MRYISLASLLLSLDDLLTKRLAALQSFSNGAANEKLLTAQRDKIAALPAVLMGRPLADELDAADARHDGSGGAIWFLIEAYLRHPDTTPAMIEAAKKIRAALPFSPGIAMDPIDGSKISIRATTPIFEYKNRLYYFSSETNKRAFASNPEQFLKEGFTKL